MVFRQILGLIVTFSSLNAFAQPLQINPEHPDQYTVVKGDTLWEIAGKFLAHPWQWPELWSQNSQIHNPNLIYPGDTVYFSITNGKPQLSLSRPSTPATGTDTGDCTVTEQDGLARRDRLVLTEDGKLAPCIRQSQHEEAIELIPVEALQPFLSSPRVVSENELNQAPYVIDFAGEHMLAGSGDSIYVRAITQPKTLAYTIYREGGTYVSPDTGEILGYQATYVADASLQQEGDPATLTITKSAREIRMGDRLMTNPGEDINLSFFPRPPEESIKGSIISVLDGVTQIGRYNVVVIDKGKTDGIQVGHELEIWQRGRVTRDQYSVIKNDEVKLPDEIAGTLMVFRPFERVSYAIVMQATRAIHVKDRVQTP
ncbi:MAG: peptidoglycan-binding protein [Methylobacter sp.]|nr:MAG: peptidoglycan-binding protein [Methylobacter sp.]PPD05452.1 MAG: peptidoglycan-binding protein [Methylobacter sp.]PPD23966.1 MAG: peptidoglycan-binding protein [Methylobacter sp.]PPD32433.1 MAG: peptidoglycan-binding protein [Methylomonas sp.]